MLFQYAAQIDVGMSRLVQQDSILVNPQLIFNNNTLTSSDYYDDTNAALFVVADGMGGGVKGELASQITINSVKDYVTKNKNLLTMNLYELVTNAIYHANQSILDHLNENPDDLSMGSTIVMGILKDGILSLGWVGDSRCYFIENDNIRQLTHDHSYVQSLVDDGKIEEEEAFNHPNRNIINQSLGMVNVIPSFDRINIPPYTKLIFCSDGLNSMLRDNDILQIVNKNQSLKSIVNDLIDLANQKGGDDNISCIGIETIPVFDKAQSNHVKQPIPAKDHKIEVKTGALLRYIILSGLILISILTMILYFNHNNTKNVKDSILKLTPIQSTQKTNLHETSTTHQETNSGYTIRLRVFKDSIKAAQYMKEIAKLNTENSISIGHPTQDLYEVNISGFDSNLSAQQFLAKGNFPDAVILYRNVSR